MKKILKIIPFFLFNIILIWGFVNINIRNTEIFSSNYIEFIRTNKVQKDELEKNTGIDFSSFNKDESIIKIYKKQNNLQVVFKDRVINLNKSMIGKIIILTVNSINNALGYFSNLIRNIV